MSICQVFRWSGLTEKIAVAVRSNTCEANQQSRNHLASSAQVFVLSCVSVFAVTTPLVSLNVLISHRISHATKADLPIPCPLAIASRMITPAASSAEPSEGAPPQQPPLV